MSSSISSDDVNAGMADDSTLWRTEWGPISDSLAALLDTYWDKMKRNEDRRSMMRAACHLARRAAWAVVRHTNTTKLNLQTINLEEHSTLGNYDRFLALENEKIRCLAQWGAHKGSLLTELDELIALQNEITTNYASELDILHEMDRGNLAAASLEVDELREELLKGPRRVVFVNQWATK